MLDRPNPIGGRVVSGPVRDDEFASFIAYHALPVRHGMTVGELALLYNAERKIGASLSVIRCRGWKRDDLYDRTGLGLDQSVAQHAQPDRGVALSGRRAARGDEPRHRPGHRHALRAHRGAVDRPGRVRGGALEGGGSGREVRSRSTSRLASASIAGQRCGGVQILVTNWDEFDPLRLGAALALELRQAVSDEVGARGAQAPAGRSGDLRTISWPAGRSVEIIVALECRSRCSSRRCGRGICSIEVKRSCLAFTTAGRVDRAGSEAGRPADPAATYSFLTQVRNRSAEWVKSVRS